MHTHNDDHVNPTYPHSELTGKIIGAAQKAHRDSGPGYRELIYQHSLKLELMYIGLECTRAVEFEV